MKAQQGMSSAGENARSGAVLMQALNWAYDLATGDIPGLGSPADLAESHLTHCGGSREKAIDHLIAWQVAHAGIAGFVTNCGGIATLPVAVPANLALVLPTQLRMIAAIAHLNGHAINEGPTRTLAFACLAGSKPTSALRQFGVNLATNVARRQITRISGAALTKINQRLGFVLVTKAGTTGLVNLTKLLPFVGGLAGGAFDATATYGIGVAAKSLLKPFDGGSFFDATIIIDPAPSTER